MNCWPVQHVGLSNYPDVSQNIDHHRTRPAWLARWESDAEGLLRIPQLMTDHSSRSSDAVRFIGQIFSLNGKAGPSSKNLNRPTFRLPRLKAILRRHLRSAAGHQLVVPSYRLNSCGLRAFSVLGPRLWNSLPRLLRDTSHSTTSFGHSLKTFFLSEY